jgi:CheY-like chemotaxis protein
LCGLKAHKSFANVPVIFLSATIGKEEEEKALALGAQGYLSKLIKKEALIEALEKYLP